MYNNHMAKQKAQVSPEASEEQVNEFKGRVAQAEEEIRPILQKYKLEMGARLNYNAQTIVAQPAWIDAKPKPSVA